MIQRLSLLSLIFCVPLMLAGCGDETSEGKKDDKKEHKDDHKHDDGDHDHYHPPHGKHGGHIADFKSESGKVLKVEWVELPKSNKVRFYTIDDKKEKLDTAIEKIKITSKHGKEPKVFEAFPVDAKDGMTAIYEAEDEKVNMALGLFVDCELEYNKEVYKAKIKTVKH